MGCTSSTISDPDGRSPSRSAGHKQGRLGKSDPDRRSLGKYGIETFSKKSKDLFERGPLPSLVVPMSVVAPACQCMEFNAFAFKSMPSSPARTPKELIMNAFSDQRPRLQALTEHLDSIDAFMNDIMLRPDTFKKKVTSLRNKMSSQGNFVATPTSHTPAPQPPIYTSETLEREDDGSGDVPDEESVINSHVLNL